MTLTFFFVLGNCRLILRNNSRKWRVRTVTKLVTRLYIVFDIEQVHLPHHFHCDGRGQHKVIHILLLSHQVHVLTIGAGHLPRPTGRPPICSLASCQQRRVKGEREFCWRFSIAMRWSVGSHNERYDTWSSTARKDTSYRTRLISILRSIFKRSATQNEYQTNAYLRTHVSSQKARLMRGKSWRCERGTVREMLRRIPTHQYRGIAERSRIVWVWVWPHPKRESCAYC